MKNFMKQQTPKLNAEPNAKQSHKQKSEADIPSDDDFHSVKDKTEQMTSVSATNREAVNTWMAGAVSDVPTEG
jgi:hypothetical protein